MVYDGRFATSGWLQEMPDPLTKIVWDNAALISKKDADTLGVGIGDMLQDHGRRGDRRRSRHLFSRASRRA